MKFGNAKVVPVAPATRAKTEFDSDAACLGGDITDLLHQGCFLRDEMCRLLLWEARSCSQSWWGDSQKDYAVTHRQNLRATAASWKAAVDKRGCAISVSRDIFEPMHSCEFDNATVNAARNELGM